MSKMTRNCYDPWEYIEFRPGGTTSPCCFMYAFPEPMATELYRFRNNASFRKVRKSLLEGDLGPECKRCAHKEFIPVEEFKERIRNRYSDLSDPVEPARHIRMVRLDMTERCNLRCTYCAASQPGYSGIVAEKNDGVMGGREMAAGEIARILEEIQRYPYEIGEIAVNGHGETTCYRGWHEICQRMLNQGHRLTITSNFARTFTPDEIFILAQFAGITISIDTSDPDLLRSIRRKADVGTILSNLCRIRACALRNGFRLPHITFHAGLYDRTFHLLPDFAWFSVACGVDAVVFWNLAKYADLEDAQNVYPIHKLDHLTFEGANDILDEVEDTLKENGIEVVLPGGNYRNDLRRSFEDRVDIRVRPGEIEDGILPLTTALKFQTNDGNRKVNVYVAASKIGVTPLLLDESGRFHRWHEGHRQPPVYRIVKRVDQEIDITLPMDGIEEDAALIIGCGDDVAGLIREVSYTTFFPKPSSGCENAVKRIDKRLG